MKYRWVGRGRDGREVRAEIDAISKEHALVRLREQQIAVTKIEPAGEGGEPPDPDSLRRHAPLEPQPPLERKPRPFAGLLLTAAFGGAGVLVRWLEGPLFLVVALMGIGGLMLVLTVLSLFEGPTNAIYAWADRKSKELRARNRPKADRFNRPDGR